MKPNVRVLLVLLAVASSLHSLQPAGETRRVQLPCGKKSTGKKLVSWKLFKHQQLIKELYRNNPETDSLESDITGRVSVPGYALGNYMLLISPAVFEDTGTYRCCINSQCGKDIVLSASKVTTSALNPVRVGSIITLICEISMMPRDVTISKNHNKIFWYLDGHFHTSTVKKRIEFTCQESNTGLWSCEPRNKNGAKFISFQHYLHVSDPIMTMNTPAETNIWKTTHEAPSMTSATSSILASSNSSGTSPVFSYPVPMGNGTPFSALYTGVVLLALALFTVFGVACFFFRRKQATQLACPHELRAVKPPVPLVREPITHLKNVPGSRDISSTAAASLCDGTVYAQVRKARNCQHDDNPDAIYVNDPMSPRDDEVSSDYDICVDPYDVCGPQGAPSPRATQQQQQQPGTMYDVVLQHCIRREADLQLYDVAM